MYCIYGWQKLELSHRIVSHLKQGINMDHKHVLHFDSGFKFYLIEQTFLRRFILKFFE